MRRLSLSCAFSMRARSFAVTLPSATALFSIFWTRAWPFSRRAASFWLSAPDFSPCSMRRSWLAWRWSMRGVLCASASAAMPTKILIGFIRVSPLDDWYANPNNAEGAVPWTRICNDLLSEIRPDVLQRIRDDAIDAPGEEPPGGCGIVDRVAGERIAAFLHRARLFRAQLLVVAVKRDAAELRHERRPIARHVAGEQAVLEPRLDAARGTQRVERKG